MNPHIHSYHIRIYTSNAYIHTCVSMYVHLCTHIYLYTHVHVYTTNDDFPSTTTTTTDITAIAVTAQTVAHRLHFALNTKPGKTVATLNRTTPTARRLRDEIRRLGDALLIQPPFHQKIQTHWQSHRYSLQRYSQSSLPGRASGSRPPRPFDVPTPRLTTIPESRCLLSTHHLQASSRHVYHKAANSLPLVAHFKTSPQKLLASHKVHRREPSCPHAPT